MFVCLLCRAISHRVRVLVLYLFFRQCNRLVCDRAVCNTTATASTQIRAHTAGAFFYSDLEISRRTLDRFNICVREYLNVEVPADLDQFG